MRLLGTLHFTVEVDAGYSVVLIIEAFVWIFGHGDGVFGPIGGGYYVILCR